MNLPHPSRAPSEPGTAARPLAALLAGVLMLGAAWAVAAETDARPAAGSGDAASKAIERGFENVSADSANGRPRIGFENRRYRHTADALGQLARDNPKPFIGVERRLGLEAAAITVEARGDSSAFTVRFPTDPDFPGVPHGPLLEPTRRTVDLLLRPAFSYELGRLTAPVQVQIQLEPMIRYNPWHGARLTGSMMIPIFNQFDFSAVHPDVENVRPGMLTFDQFAWIRGAALTSGTIGLLGDNRFGGSIGAARPFAGGRFIADAQVDLTGFVAFQNSGLTYSTPRQWSSIASLSYIVPVFDAVLRVRGGQFLYGDRGVQGEFSRSFGDFEYSLAILRSKAGRMVQTVRITLPVPPMTRATQQPVRVQPIERFPISYRTDATPVGTFVTGVASREDYLRQLSEPGLQANAFRMDRAMGRPRPPQPEEVEWVNASGVTGFIFTPWADVIHERTVSIDYTDVPAKWAYSGRGDFVNQAYSMTLGLLPRIEATLRFTRLPGAAGFLPGDIDNEITTDTDHEASGRLVVLTPRNGRPGLALGIEDISGTRRFHDTYAVVGMPLEINLLQMRFSLGYAPTVFTAARHVLEGGFGAVEVSPWRVVAVRAEHDSEKWNVGVGVVLPLGLRLRVAALNLETLSAGAGWTHKL